LTELLHKEDIYKNLGPNVAAIKVWWKKTLATRLIRIPDKWWGRATVL